LSVAAKQIRAQDGPGAARNTALGLLALANLFWAGNWVIGRALRDTLDPVTLNFFRWLIVVLVLAPFAWRAAYTHRTLIREHARWIFVLALTGVVLFQLLLYEGLRTTTTINAVLLNSSSPLFIMLCSWFMERERATRGQMAGMLISLAGIVIILARGEVARLTQVEFHLGDLWILLAMAIWGIYSVMLKRRPAQLGGVLMLFVVSVAGLALMLPLFAWRALQAPLPVPDAAAIGAVFYIALAASIGSFICWNKGVAVVGANTASVSMHLLPAFGTILAILLLGETFQLFHAAGIATILIGVVVATRAVPPRPAVAPRSPS
jgi:drug/metabolite transporter (DMT)-like permease